MNTAIVGLSLIESKLKEMTISPMSKYLLSLTNDVQESCEDAVKILSGILDYEKLGAGVMVLEQSWINPLPLFHDAVKPFIMLAQLKQITLRANSSDIPADKVENLAVYVDEAKIGQVVRNFVSNAIKFTPPGGSIDVVTSIVRHNLESFLRFEVIDSGPGIATADIGKVFNDVVQFNANTQQAGGGSGIGLWICKKIVDLHGGHVRVESVLGSGCKFILELYVKSDESGLSNLSSKAPSSKLAANILGSKKSARVVPSDSSSARSNPNRILKVLVVDDSKLNRKMMARLMESKGHNCLEACNGQEAVDICGAFVFDIILMDNCMPVLMGGEATRVLRSKGYKGVIIGVTGDALQRDVDDFLACGVNAVLSKPIDPFLFDEALQNIMRQHTADVS